MVIIDTSVIIDHLRSAGNSQTTVLIKLAETYPKEALAISIITVQELYEGKSTLSKQKEQQLLATISPLKVIPLTFEVAKRAGELARDLTKDIGLADATIAASCLIHNCSLSTLDKKDFGKIKGLTLV